MRYRINAKIKIQFRPHALVFSLPSREFIYIYMITSRNYAEVISFLQDQVDRLSKCLRKETPISSNCFMYHLEPNYQISLPTGS
jgi:hypothetical protein